MEGMGEETLPFPLLKSGKCQKVHLGRSVSTHFVADWYLLTMYGYCQEKIDVGHYWDLKGLKEALDLSKMHIYSNKPHIINLPYIFNLCKLLFVCPGDSLHISPLERSFKAKVLMHFPSNVEWNPFDEDAVRMVSLFCTNKFF